MPATLEPTFISGLSVAHRTAFADARGSFYRLFCAEEFSLPRGRAIVQMNHSVTRGTGTVRGMHFQRPPHTETKIVTCLEGEIFDVAVDLRAKSPTFLKWHGVRLSGPSRQSLVIPDGMAHGFQVLSDEAVILYLHDELYHPESEGRIHPLDPRVHIEWPEPVQNLSASDANAAYLEADFCGLAIF